jgi:TatD DNase family protein
MFLDSHCHLDDPAFDNDLENVIERARDAGLRYLLTIGTDLPGARRSLELAERYDFIYAAAAIHPHDAAAARAGDFDAFRRLYEHPKVLAVGETGLDFYYDNSPREAQEKVFREFLRIALEPDRPIIIHLRNPKDGPPAATERFLRIVAEEASGPVRGIMHCFTGTGEEARELIRLGFHISLPGVLTYPKAEALRETARRLPYERLLIETDCPYLAPVPKRGQRNEPSFVVYTAEKLAELRGITAKDLDRILLYNFETLFRLRKGPEEGRIAYEIRGNLYMNITNRCTCACTFCDRTRDALVSGYYLGLDKEPTVEEIMEAVGDASRFRQIVFCGYGEPTIRLEVVKETAKRLKEKGVSIRLNTNGHAELIHGRDILPELEGLVDQISVSLNAATPEEYNRLCLPDFGEESFEAVKRFIRRAVELGFDVIATAVEVAGVDLGAVRELAESLGARFRGRVLNVVG